VQEGRKGRSGKKNGKKKKRQPKVPKFSGEVGKQGLGFSNANRRYAAGLRKEGLKRVIHLGKMGKEEGGARAPNLEGRACSKRSTGRSYQFSYRGESSSQGGRGRIDKREQKPKRGPSSVILRKENDGAGDDIGGGEAAPKGPRESLKVLRGLDRTP